MNVVIVHSCTEDICSSRGLDSFGDMHTRRVGASIGAQHKHEDRMAQEKHKSKDRKRKRDRDDDDEHRKRRAEKLVRFSPEPSPPRPPRLRDVPPCVATHAGAPPS